MVYTISSICSIDTLLYPYALPILQIPYPFSRLCLSCNLSFSLRLLQFDPDLWDNNFHTVSLYGSMEHLVSDALTLKNSSSG